MSRELDEQVAEALGLELMGWEPARPDPEAPGWYVSFWAEEKQPIYLGHCNCDLRDELIDGPDLEPLACGHLRWCLEVVPFYSTDIATAFPLFERLGPAWCLSQADSGWDDAYRWWCWLPTEYGGDGTDYMAPMPAEAICLAFVAVKEAT